MTGGAPDLWRPAGKFSPAGTSAAAAPVATPGAARPIGSPVAALVERVRSYDPKADTGLVEQAYALPEEAHRTQKRHNGDPYIGHPVAVAEILAGYRLDVASVVTALLHDTIEDTRVTLRDL